MFPEIYHLLYITYQNLNLLYTGDGGHGGWCFGLGNCITVAALSDSTHQPHIFIIYTANEHVEYS